MSPPATPDAARLTMTHSLATVSIWLCFRQKWQREVSRYSLWGQKKTLGLLGCFNLKKEDEELSPNPSLLDRQTGVLTRLACEYHLLGTQVFPREDRSCTRQKG